MPLFLHWVTYTEDRERLIAERGQFRPSFVHEDTLPFLAERFATRRRQYATYQSEPSRVSKDRSDHAAETYKGDYYSTYS